MAEDEKWRPIPGFSERYMVSSRGRVARILKGAVTYGVTAATIRDIKKYKIWKELPDAK
jgi:hypothetical protein